MGEDSTKLLRGHGVVVTGAGRGLGRAYALDLARTGAAVVVNDIDAGPAEAVAAEISDAGGRAVVSTHDIADAGGAEALVGLAVDSFGRLDGFVNNAGLYHETLIWDEDPARVRRVIEVNVLGAYNCTIFAARAMAEGGSIVNACSGGLFGFPTTATYGTSKGGVLGLTYGAALDLDARGIRVNAISPKALTRLTEDALGRKSDPLGGEEAPLAEIEELLPEGVAPLVTFLLSDLAAGITGQFLRFDGRKLAVVPMAGFDEHPTEVAPSWDPPALSAAFDGPLRGALQPFGVERRVPPRSTGGSGATTAAGASA